MPLATPALDLLERGRSYPSLHDVARVSDGVQVGDVVEYAGQRVLVDEQALVLVADGRTRLDVCAVIFARMAKGDTVATAGKPCGVDAILLYTWGNRSLCIGKLYAHARQAQAHGMADRITDLALEARGAKTPEEAAAYRLEVDARKWMASKIAPRLYGERLTTENVSEVRVIIQRAEIPQEVAGRWAEVTSTDQGSAAFASEAQALSADTLNQ